MFTKTIERYKSRLKKYAERYLVRPDMERDKAFKDIYNRVASRQNKFTMTSMERCYALFQSVRYLVEKDIPGDIVECGVWRGGSSMLAALTLIKLNQTHRRIYLYDTFEGMSKPTEKDVDLNGVPYRELIDSERELLTVSLDIVKQNLFSTGYPEDNLVFVKGNVEDTLPGTTSQSIALLRLDTDFYESTYHELIHLYPLLSAYGVLIIDDYGHFAGAREATDRFFEETPDKVLLNRVDYSCRMAIKPC